MTVTPVLINHYAVKFVFTWALILSLFSVLRISHPLPIPHPARFPLWMLGLLDLLETYGMTLLLAAVLASIWQLSKRQRLALGFWFPGRLTSIPAPTAYRSASGMDLHLFLNRIRIPVFVQWSD
jgi:hypothetical protein